MSKKEIKFFKRFLKELRVFKLFINRYDYHFIFGYDYHNIHDYFVFIPSYDVISNAFTWEETSEGYQYWYYINDLWRGICINKKLDFDEIKLYMEKISFCLKK